MYQLEVKRWLVSYRFPTSEGWSVLIDIDAMERAKGGQHKPEKAGRASVAENALRSMGVAIGAHPDFGRADIVAEHPTKGLFIVEVEGTSSRQKEQALYSALGQGSTTSRHSVGQYLLHILVSSRTRKNFKNWFFRSQATCVGTIFRARVRGDLLGHLCSCWRTWAIASSSLIGMRNYSQRRLQLPGPSVKLAAATSGAFDIGSDDGA